VQVIAVQWQCWEVDDVVVRSKQSRKYASPKLDRPPLSVVESGFLAAGGGCDGNLDGRNFSEIGGAPDERVY